MIGQVGDGKGKAKDSVPFVAGVGKHLPLLAPLRRELDHVKDAPVEERVDFLQWVVAQDVHVRQPACNIEEQVKTFFVERPGL